MNPQMVNLLIDATLETLLMVGVSGLAALFLGVPLGVALIVTDKGGLLQNLAVNRVLGAIINATRSVPFIILMVAIIPFTRFIAGTSIGTTAAIVPWLLLPFHSWPGLPKRP